MDIKTIDDSLRFLGLSDFDRQVYLTVFRQGKTSLTNLARKLEVERLTIYRSLDRLQKIGLIPQSEEYSRVITAEPPSRILSLLQKQRNEIEAQEEQIQEALPNLMAQFVERSRTTAIRLFEGREQFLTVYEEALREANGEILYYGDADSLILYGGIEYEKRWIKRRVKKRLSIRVLVSPFRHEGVKKIQQTDKKELREVRFINGKVRFNSSFMIYGFKTVLWNPLVDRALVIDDPTLTGMFKHLFETSWKVSLINK